LRKVRNSTFELLEAPVGHQPGRDLERGEERGGSLALVVMRLLLWDPGPQQQDRQSRQRPVQGLDLGLLVDTHDDRLRRRGQVEADDIADLRLELGVGGELERLGLPRLQPPPPPDPGHRR